jgi:hypothetical protein
MPQNYYILNQHEKVIAEFAATTQSKSIAKVITQKQ